MTERRVVGIGIIAFGWSLLHKLPMTMVSIQQGLGVDDLALAILFSVFGVIYGFIDLPVQWLMIFAFPILFYMELTVVRVLGTLGTMEPSALGPAILFQVLIILICMQLYRLYRST